MGEEVSRQSEKQMERPCAWNLPDASAIQRGGQSVQSRGRYERVVGSEVNKGTVGREERGLTEKGSLSYLDGLSGFFLSEKE